MEYWETLMMALDFLIVSGLVAKSFTFWVMMISMPSYRVFVIDKQMRFVYGDDDPSFLSASDVSIPVLHDLILDPFQYEEHLGVGGRIVFIRQKPLEIEGKELFFRREGSMSVP